MNAKAAADKAKGRHMPDEEEPELVSRGWQAGLGLFTAVLVYSAAFGGLFGLAFAFAYGRTPGTLTPQALSALLAATGFVAIYLVPNLKYPANPPSVGDPETIGARTALYFLMIAISLAAMVGSARLKRLFVVRAGEWNANLIAAGCYIARGRNCFPPASDCQRGSGGVSRGRAVEIPHRFGRSAIHHVGYARLAVWRANGLRRDEAERICT